MKIHLKVLALSLFLLTTNSAFADTVSTGWFNITELRTAFSSSNLLLIIGDYPNSPDEAPNSCAQPYMMLFPLGSGSDQDPNSKNYEGAYKLLTSAFLSGKQVNIKWSGCISGYGSVRQVMVCADNEVCGQ